MKTAAHSLYRGSMHANNSVASSSMGGGWAAWPRCWPTRWRAVVLCMFLALTATATLTAEQEEELVTLIDA